MELSDKFVYFPGSYPVKYILGSFKVFSKDRIWTFRISTYIVINVLYLFKNVVSEFDISSWIIKDLLTNIFKLELLFDLLQNVTYHQLNTLAYEVKVIVLVELITTLKDTIDCLDIFCRVTNLVVYNPGLIHQQIVIDKDVLSTEMKSVSSKVVKLIHVDSIDFVAYNLKLPFSFSHCVSID